MNRGWSAFIFNILIILTIFFSSTSIFAMNQSEKKAKIQADCVTFIRYSNLIKSNQYQTLMNNRVLLNSSVQYCVQAVRQLGIQDHYRQQQEFLNRQRFSNPEYLIYLNDSNADALRQLQAFSSRTYTSSRSCKDAYLQTMIDVSNYENVALLLAEQVCVRDAQSIGIRVNAR